MAKRKTKARAWASTSVASGPRVAAGAATPGQRARIDDELEHGLARGARGRTPHHRRGGCGWLGQRQLPGVAAVLLDEHDRPLVGARSRLSVTRGGSGSPAARRAPAGPAAGGAVVSSCTASTSCSSCCCSAARTSACSAAAAAGARGSDRGSNARVPRRAARRGARRTAASSTRTESGTSRRTPLTRVTVGMDEPPPRPLLPSARAATGGASYASQPHAPAARRRQPRAGGAADPGSQRIQKSRTAGQAGRTPRSRGRCRPPDRRAGSRSSGSR